MGYKTRGIVAKLTWSTAKYSPVLALRDLITNELYTTNDKISNI